MYTHPAARFGPLYRPADTPYGPHFIRQGDTGPIYFTAGVGNDLTGATVALHVRKRGTGTVLEMPSQIVDPETAKVAVFECGALAVGTWDIECRVTAPDGSSSTVPSYGYEQLVVSRRMEDSSLTEREPARPPDPH